MDLVSNFGVPPIFCPLVCNMFVTDVSHTYVSHSLGGKAIVSHDQIDNRRTGYIHTWMYTSVPISTPPWLLPTATPNWLRKDRLHITTHCHSQLVTEGHVTVTYHYPLPLPIDYRRTGYTSLLTATPNWLQKDRLYTTTHCCSHLITEGQVTHDYPLPLPWILTANQNWLWKGRLHVTT